MRWGRAALERLNSACKLQVNSRPAEPADPLGKSDDSEKLVTGEQGRPRQVEENAAQGHADRAAVV